MREHHREDVGVAEAYQRDAHIDGRLAVEDKQPRHGHQHHHDTQPKELARRHPAQDESPEETPDGAEDEVKARGKPGLVQRHAPALNEQLGSRGVRAHVDAHVAHDAQKAQQHKRMAQQPEAGGKAGSIMVGLFFPDGSKTQQHDGHHGHHHVDREQHPPPHAQRRHGLGGSPHGDVRGQEGGYGLDKLAQREGARQALAADDVAQQRIERRLHQGVADAQQRKRCQHEQIAVAKYRQKQRHERHQQT